MTTRRLAAILAADVVGYSKLVGEDETGTLAALREIRKGIVNPVLAEHGGRVFKLMGDGMLAEFPSAVQALRAAIGIQERLSERNASSGRRIEVRIGVHQGDVVVEGADLLGDGVNIAARLEALAEPGDICISGRVYEDAAGKLALDAEDMGDQSLKNIARPVRVYRVALARSSVRQDHAARPALPLPDKPSIAVLPFQNMSGDPEQEYFADGMVEEIITALSRVKTFFVIARNSSFTYKGKAVDVKQVGRELGVRYVLEGSVRKAASRVRIAGQLIEAETNHHVWADRFEGTLEDIFGMQDRVTESIVGALVPSLQVAEIERAKAKPTDNLVAYDLYLRSLPHLYSMTREGNDEALKLLHRAIAIEPDYALAKAVAAQCYVWRIGLLWTTTEEERSKGVRFAREALTSHRDDPMTLTYAGSALGYLAHEYDNARKAIDRSTALNPNSAINYAKKGYLEMWLGNASAAEDALRRAMRLSPLDLEMGWMMFGLAVTHSQAGRFQEGVEAGFAAIREMPTSQGYVTVIYCLVALGRTEEARELGDRLMQFAPHFTVQKHIQTLALRDEGRKNQLADALRLAGLPE
jgi:adenylate cyclase